MTLDILENIRAGLRRTYTDNGVIFTAMFFVLGVLNTGVALAFTGLNFGPGMSFGTVLQLIGLSVFSTALAIASIVTAIAAIRVFTTDETKKVPSSAYRENLLTPFLNLFVGGIVAAIILAAGFALFVIPGIFLAVSLVYWQFFVIMEGQNFVEAMKSSWNMTKGRRLRVFGLVVAASVVAAVISALMSIPSSFIGPVGILLAQVGNAVAAVFLVATLAESFRQLKND